MKRTLQLRLASAALSAVVLLPIHPVSAQEATQSPATTPDVVVTTPPLSSEPELPKVSLPEPNPALTQPVVTNSVTAEPEERPRATERRPVRRSSAPAATAARSAPRAPAAAPAPTASAPAQATPIEAPPAAAVEAAPVPQPLPVDTPAAVPAARATGPGSILPWLIGGLLLAGLAAFFFVRGRRRRLVTDDYRTAHFEESYAPADPFGEAPVAHEPDTAFAAEPVAAVAPAAAPLNRDGEVGRPVTYAADQEPMPAASDGEARDHVPVDPFGDAPPAGTAEDVAASQPMAAADEELYGDDYVPSDPFGEAPATNEANDTIAETAIPATTDQQPYGKDYVPADPFGEAPADSDRSAILAAAPIAGAAAAAPAEASGREDAPIEPVGEIEAVSISEPEAEELAAVTPGPELVAERPWLELMMRPLRAGTTQDEAKVEFELTVGNNGAVPAEDVRISSWMFAAGTVQESSMERMLIDPPAETTLSQVTIPAGHGAKIAASISMPRSILKGPVLPVVVADARYRLPDGGEGRISASFAVGHMAGEEIEPFSIDDPSLIEEGIGSRLYGEVHSS